MGRGLGGLDSVTPYLYMWYVCRVQRVGKIIGGRDHYTEVGGGGRTAAR
jgi:hypothetical protein